MWQPEKKTTKVAVLAGLITVTLGIHYGWLIEPFFGHVHWLHVIHGRFCYIPIVIGAAWFGLRGGLLTALAISLLVLPYVFGGNLATGSLAGEFAEIFFYFAIATLVGGLLDRELRTRRRASEMRLQLERSQKMSLVGQIAAGMAHEIKNPLASIKGAVEILSDESNAPQDRDEFKDIVFKEIKRINGSVTDFLEFARPGETRRVKLNLSDTVASGLKQVQPQAARREILLTSEIESPVWVKGDEDKIHQVLLNLVLNAIDASPDGSTVTIELAAVDEQAIITVADNGDGIPEDSLGKIFEPFFTTKSSGTGLGLAIARNIVDHHYGTLTLSNRDGGGAIAKLTVPTLPSGGRA